MTITITTTHGDSIINVSTDTIGENHLTVDAALEHVAKLLSGQVRPPSIKSLRKKQYWDCEG